MASASGVSCPSIVSLVANHMLGPSPAGGVMVLAETFDHVIFRQSLARMFERDADLHLSMAFNATVEASLDLRAARLRGKAV